MPEPRSSQLLTTAALAALMLVYSNGDAWLAMRRPRPITSPVNARHLAALLSTLLWASAEHLPAQEIGLSRRGVGRSLIWGFAAGALGSFPIRLFFALPIVVNRAVTQPQPPPLTSRRLVVLALGQMLLSTAVFEEVAFRGLLHAKLSRLFGVRRALLVGSVLFSAWHAVIAWHNVRSSTLPRKAQPAIYGAAMALLFAAGLLFGTLREATGHLAGSIVAHWLLVVSIVLAVARRPEVRPTPW